MKILFVADIHIKLGQKNVPIEFQKARVMQLAEEINKIPHEYIVIGGDLLDVAKPTLPEVGLMYEFLHKLDNTGFIIPGNHEMISKKVDCFIHVDNMIADLGFEVIREFTTTAGIDFIPYNILHDKTWPSPCSKFCITHIRGEIPPHVQPEVDLDRFAAYDKVFAGDLHSYTNSQENILYPGSPFTTSFRRSEAKGANGVFIIDSDTGEHEWVELFLPQLIKKTVNREEDMVATDYHHTIYELEGSLEELSGVKDNKLLSKKVTTNISAPSTLNLQGTREDELAEYLTNIKNIKDTAPYISLYTELVHDTDK